MINVITKNAVFITGTIFFFGFYKFQSYYSNFDIEIYKYLTAFELSKSFVSIIIGCLLPLAAVHYGGFLIEKAVFFFMGRKATRKYHQSPAVRTPIKLGCLILFNRRIGAFHKLCLLGDILKHPYTRWFFCFALVSGGFLDSILFCQVQWKAQPFFFSNEVIFYVVSAIWLAFIWEPMICLVVLSQMKQRPTPKNLWLLRGINYSLIVLYFLHFSQRIDAQEKLHAEVAEHYTFYFKSGETIRTSKDTILIGETENYVFLRDNVNKSNWILERSEMKKVSKQTDFDPGDTFFSRPLPVEKMDSLMTQMLPSWARGRVASK